jgi:CubicO group peptidase (beta-lactamase class C family)
VPEYTVRVGTFRGAFAASVAVAVLLGGPVSAVQQGASVKGPNTSARAAKTSKVVKRTNPGKRPQSQPTGDSLPVVTSGREQPVSPAPTSVSAPTSPGNPAPASHDLPRTVPTVELDVARRQRLQAILETWTANQTDIESVTVALRFAGQTWDAAARRDRGPAPDAKARYRAMSITKTVTAALVFRSVEAGLIDLDAPLPTIDGVGVRVPGDITVRQLLAHRSGLADYTEAPGYLADQPMTPEKAVELSLRAPRVAPPGTATRYVNSNYLLLGLLLQQIHHHSLVDQVADLVGPLGMTDTRLEPPDRPGWAGFASGGIMSTASDLALWGEALFTPGRIVSPASMQLMSTTGDLQGGLGLWGVCPCDGSPGLGRFTAIGHFTAAGGMFHFPRTGITLVMKADPATGDTIARMVALHDLLAAELLHETLGKPS